MKKCKCTQGYCCDYCWRRDATSDPCGGAKCKNPKGHLGACGPFNNTGVLVITAQELIGAIQGKR